jgi:hypothetical protein
MKEELKAVKNPLIKIAGIAVASVVGVLGAATVAYSFSKNYKITDLFMNSMKSKGVLDSAGKIGPKVWTKKQPSKSSAGVGLLIGNMIETARLFRKPKTPPTEWNGRELLSDDLDEPFSSIPQLVEWNKKPLLFLKDGKIHTKYEGQFGLDEAYPGEPNRPSGSTSQDICESRQSGRSYYRVGTPTSQYGPTKYYDGTSPDYENFRRKDTGSINWDAVFRCGRTLPTEGGTVAASQGAKRRRIIEAYEDDRREWTVGLNEFITYNKMVDIVYKADEAYNYFRNALKEEIDNDYKRDLANYETTFENFKKTYLGYVKQFMEWYDMKKVPINSNSNANLLKQMYNVLLFLGMKSFKQYKPTAIALPYLYNMLANMIWEKFYSFVTSGLQGKTIDNSIVYYILDRPDFILSVNLLDLGNIFVQMNEAVVTGKFDTDNFVLIDNMAVPKEAGTPPKETPLWYATLADMDAKEDGVLFPFVRGLVGNGFVMLDDSSKQILRDWEYSLPDFIPKDFFADKTPPPPPPPPVNPPPTPPPEPLHPLPLPPLPTPLPASTTKEPMRLGLDLLNQFKPPNNKQKRRRFKLYALMA